MLSNEEKTDLAKLRSIYGSVSAEHALREASEYEKVAARMPEHDPGYRRYKAEASGYTKLAELTTKEAQG